jgi:hypothetical protein
MTLRVREYERHPHEGQSKLIVVGVSYVGTVKQVENEVAFIEANRPRVGVVTCPALARRWVRDPKTLTFAEKSPSFFAREARGRWVRLPSWEDARALLKGIGLTREGVEVKQGSKVWKGPFRSLPKICPWTRASLAADAARAEQHLHNQMTLHGLREQWARAPELTLSELLTHSCGEAARASMNQEPYPQHPEGGLPEERCSISGPTNDYLLTLIKWYLDRRETQKGRP